MAILAIVTTNATNRALLVGISDYGNPRGNYPDRLWRNINGANDVALLRPILEQEQGFQVISLTDGEATYANIIKSLKTIEKQCRKGDVVYLHFSTHGQLVEDVNSDEPDKWDEAIVPVDAPMIGKKGVYEGTRHLTDDKLSVYISSIRHKVGAKGMVYVVLDACFSGDSSRGDEEFTRGSHKGFTRNGYVDITPKNIKNRKVSTFAKLDCPSGYSHVTYLEACQSDEINTEIKDISTGKHYGPLSYHIAAYLLDHKLDNEGNWTMAIQNLMRKDSRVMHQKMKIESSIIK